PHLTVVMTAVVMAITEDHGAGEEDDRQDEDDPGNDHHPRRGRVDLRRLDHLRWWGRRDRRRLCCAFRCFTHALNTAPESNCSTRFRRQSCWEVIRTRSRSRYHRNHW